MRPRARGILKASRCRVVDTTVKVKGPEPWKRAGASIVGDPRKPLAWVGVKSGGAGGRGCRRRRMQRRPARLPRRSRAAPQQGRSQGAEKREPRPTSLPATKRVFFETVGGVGLLRALARAVFPGGRGPGSEAGLNDVDLVILRLQTGRGGGRRTSGGRSRQGGRTAARIPSS